MTRAWKRRADLVFGAAAGHMIKSRWIIWCIQSKHMPAMIDLLVAQGSLSESDRPHCVHCGAVRSPGTMSQEEVGKILDAEEMLEKAGIRTLMAEGWEAYMQGPQQLQAFLCDRVGASESEAAETVARLGSNAESLRERYAVAPFPFYDRETVPGSHAAE
jgi:hypothetical protein